MFTRFLLFPPAMVLLLLLALPLVFAAARRRASGPRFATMIVLYICAASVAIRGLVDATIAGYSSYYNGRVVLAFLLLLDLLVFPQFNYYPRIIALGRHPLYGGVSFLRAYVFTPRVVVPGEMMREQIRNISRAPVQYLIWPNRTFEEYGVKEFGTDFDQPLGQYFHSHFRLIQPILETVSTGSWSATIWRRLPEGSRP